MKQVSDARDYYETLVRDYDEISNKIVMENTALQQTVFDAISVIKNPHPRILDLGVGTASMARKILETYPSAYVVGVDFSEEMMRVAARNLSDFQERFQLIRTDISTAVLERYGTFDAVLSAVTIHNISHKAKVELFQKIFVCLDTGGIFVNGDFVAGETLSEEMETKIIYKNFLKCMLAGDELHKWLEHAFEFDKPMKLSEQVNILHAAGFKEVKTVWQYPREAVYVAFK